FLSEDEVDALLGHLSRRGAQAGPGGRVPRAGEGIIPAPLFSGLRNSEVCGLALATTGIGTSPSPVPGAGTPPEERDVFVPRELRELVGRFVKEVRPNLLGEGISPRDLSQPLVMNEGGRPYERTGLYRRVVRILTEAGLRERASVQLLRHTYG